MLHHFGCNRRLLYNTAVGRNIAFKHCDAAKIRKGIVDRTYYLGVSVYNTFEIFLHGLACYGHYRCIKQVFLCKFLHNGINTACSLKILHKGVARRSKVTKIRCIFADFVRHIKADFNACLMRNCRKVKHCIRGTAESHVNSLCIVESRPGHNISGADILFNKLHYLHTCMLCKTQSCRKRRRNGAVARECHTDSLGKTVHRVCGVHTRTGTARGASVFFIVTHTALVDITCLICADRLKHVAEAGTATVFKMTGKHRTARTENCRDIKSCRRHKQSRNVFVAVRNHYKSVKLMCHNHSFGRVGDKITCNK